MTDGQGRTDYTYDTWSRLRTETRQFNGVAGSWQLQYEYNLAGELTSLTDAFGQRVDYGYNPAGELLTVSMGGVNYASGMRYRAWGAPKQMDLGNNLRETMGYNTRLQATQYEVRQGGGSGALILGFQYRYDFDGQVNNLNDGRVRLAHDLTATNSTMERSFSYDHAGRLTSARSGSEAAGQGGIPTGPFQHTYGFDAFDNMTTRGGRNGYVPISAQPINYNATYVNDRNQAWTYNESGNVLFADQQQYQWDAAGQMSRAQTMNLYLYQDGDGQDVLRSLDGVDTYYIRSSVLGGLVVGEIGVNGGHQRTYLYANGRRIARQKDGNTYWLSQDAANVANIETDINGEIWARAQLDPLGVLTGTGPPGQTPPGGSFNTSGYYGNAGSPGDGCRLDGAPMPCDWVARVVNAGDSVQCPNNDCGPIPIRDSQGNPTGGFESFRATADGRSGWLPINAIFNGSDNGSWHYPGSDFGGQLSQSTGQSQDPQLPRGHLNFGYILQLVALGNANVEAEKRLQDPRCAALFNWPFLDRMDPIDVAEMEMNGETPNFGLDYLQHTSYRILPLGAPTIETKGSISRINAIGAATNGYNDVWINSQGPFFNYRPNIPGRGTVLMDAGTGLDQTSFAAMARLHELGHQVGIFGHDADNLARNRMFTQAVIDACFPDARNHR